MRNVVRQLAWCLSAWALVGLAGCSDPDRGAGEPAGSPSPSPPASAPGGAAAPAAAATGTTPPGPAGKPAEVPPAAAPAAFVAPPLAEVDAQANWIDQPVENLLDLRRKEDQATQPPLSVAEALALRNDSKENNDKLVATLGRVAQQADEVDYDAVLNRHIKADAKSTNPLFQSSVYEADVMGLIGLTPFTFDRDMNRFGDADVVVSWQTSSDRMLDKIVLRNDLTWTDGQPVTAHDLEFAFHTVMSPKISVPAIKTSLARLKGVKAYDDRTLVYFHKEALATNIWNIGIPFIPKHVYEKTLQEDPTMEQSPAHVELEKNPVTCGPYRVVERQLGSSYLFERRDDWYQKEGRPIREKPYFKQVRMRVISELNTALLALKKGEIDEMELSAEQWVNQTNDDSFYEQNTKASGIEWTTYLFTWNLNTPFFSDARVRKAMGYAFNHKELLEKQNFGLFEAANGPYHQTSWMSPKPGPAPYIQDLDKAEALLDEAGWVDSDNDGIRDKLVDGKRVKFEFSIICTPVEERKIGVICNVSPLDFAVLQERTVEHKFQAAFGGWGAGADPDLSFNIYGTNEGRNYGLYSNPEVDRLFKEARGEFDREKRAKLYARIHELIYEDQPMTYLFTKNSFYAFSKKLRGYRFSPRGPYHYGPGAFSLYKVKN
jgi:peptide/nickel transport system substrate-binding protein